MAADQLRLSNTMTFARMARMNLRTLRAGIREMTVGGQGFHLPGVHITFELFLVTVVFAAAAVEAYVYEYAARKLSDRFVRRYLDQLGIVSKWVVIPQLTTGRNFPRDGEAFQRLRRLVSDRNKIVHFKSQVLDLEYLENVSPEDLVAAWSDGAENAVATLDSLVEVMRGIDPDEPAGVHLLLESGHRPEQRKDNGTGNER